MRKTTVFCLLISLICLTPIQKTLAQRYEEHFCGFAPSLPEIFSLDQLAPEIRAYTTQYKMGPQVASRQMFNMPIQFHVVSENASNMVDTALLVPFLDSLNKYFLPIDVSFFQCGPIHFITAPSTVNVSILTTHPPFQTLYNRANVINIYFALKIVNGTSSASGTAGFPFSENDAIFLTNAAATQCPTFVHEMGHYFGLYHTFGKNNSCYTNPGNVPTPFAGELVDGSNCSFAGDDICDTPASPCLTGKVDTFCHYTGTVKDANNTAYLPDVSNFMEYSPISCRTHFSPEQYARMAYFRDKYHASKFCPGATVQYCPSKGLNTTKAWIAQVKIANIDKTSGDNAGYGDFISDTIRGVQGKMYALRLEPGFACVERPVYWRVFVDFNHDKDFDDEGEILFDNSTLSTGITSAPIDLPFFMPYNAPPGIARLRVSMRYPENGHGDFTGGTFNYGSALPPNACENIVNGEVEDYTLVVDADNTMNPYCVPSYIRYRPYNYVETANVGPFSKRFLNSSKYLYYTADTIVVARNKQYTGAETKVGNTSFIDFNRNKVFEWNNTPTNEFFQPTYNWVIPATALPGNTRARVGSGYEEGCDDYPYMDFVVKVVTDPDLKYPLTTRYEPSFQSWVEAVALDTNLVITGPVGASADFSSGVQLDLLREAEHEVLTYRKNNNGTVTLSSDVMGIDTGNGFFDNNDVQLSSSAFPPRQFTLTNNSSLPAGITRLAMPLEDEQYLFGLQVISKCGYKDSDFSSSKAKMDSVVWNNKLLKSLGDLNRDVLPQSGPFTLFLSPMTDTALVKWYAWLDIDGDGLFNSPGEMLLSSGQLLGSQTFQLNIPNGMQRGLRKLRVRVVSAYDPQANNPDPCFSAFQNGQLIEYGLYFNDFHLIGSNTWTPDNAGEFPFIVPMPLNEPWTIQGSSPWVSFYPPQGMGKDTSALIYLKNDSETPRTAVFTLQSATFSKKITITQFGAPVAGIPDTLYFSKDGGQVSIPLSLPSGSTPLQFFDMEPWVKTNLQNTQLAIVCEPNQHLKRQGRLVFRTKQGRPKSFVVVQEGKEAAYFEFPLDTFYLPGNRGGDTLITIHTNDNFSYRNLLTPVWLWPYFGLKEDASVIATDPCADHMYFRYADNVGGSWRYTLVEATTVSGLKKKLVVVQDGIVATEPEPKAYAADFSIFPNPSSGSFVVSDLPPGGRVLCVYSPIGLQVFRADGLLDNTINITANGWAPGLYVVELRGSFGAIQKKILLVH